MASKAESQGPSSAQADMIAYARAENVSNSVHGAPIPDTCQSGDTVRVEHQLGEVPAPRFGHTTTNVGNNKVVLFGGAVGDAGRYNITADTFLFDCSTFRWSKLSSDNIPNARAAHGAACVDTMQLVVYGGATGGGTLSSDELYLLDLRKSNLCWMTVPFAGVTPGRRYGHALVYHKPNLIVFGGNDGCKTVNDIWQMDVERSPFTWKEVTLSSSRGPAPRVYHSAEICREGAAMGMMVIFGGRNQENRSLKDSWGLRQHRDGRWDWVEAPIKKGKLPDARYQHTSAFLGTKLLIIGGRADNDCTRSLPTALYDTETVEWRYLPSIARFRHSSWCIRNQIYAFGGFGHKTQHHPTEDLQSLDCTAVLSFYNDREIEEQRKKKAQAQGSQTKSTQLPTSSTTVGGQTHLKPNDTVASQAPHSNLTESSPSRPAQGNTGVSTLLSWVKESGSTVNAQQAPTAPIPNKVSGHNPSSTTYTPQPAIPGRRPPNPKLSADIRLSSHAHAVHDTHQDFSSLVRRISIERLEDEGKKINKPAARVTLTPLLENTTMMDSLESRIIRKLLQPKISIQDFQKQFDSEEVFSIPWDDVSELCEKVDEIVKADSMLLRLRAPIKVYGDIHGQYYDLMRLFSLYKTPIEEDLGDAFGWEGDIDSTDYLFLGDYVDRGSHSLETICLLFALKVKYPLQIHLIRGNHEDPTINCIYGFQDECSRRLREDTGAEDSCWNKFNVVFENLPIGALIEDKILCIHGGIGGSITDLNQLEMLDRPLKVPPVPTNLQEQRITDLLWSDPTDNDSILGIIPNEVRDPDGSGRIVKYGPDRVHKFLTDNNLSLIIRAHECVMDGFERFAGGKLITLFSATNYCNHHHNAGALLFIRRDLTVVPKLIYSPEAQFRINTWDQRMTELRPPTPPRALPRMREREFSMLI